MGQNHQVQIGSKYARRRLLLFILYYMILQGYIGCISCTKTSVTSDTIQTVFFYKTA